MLAQTGVYPAPLCFVDIRPQRGFAERYRAFAKLHRAHAMGSVLAFYG
jgi:hypothetical protein